MGAIATLGIGAASMSNAISGMKNNATKAMIRENKKGDKTIGALPSIGNKIKDIYSRFK